MREFFHDVHHENYGYCAKTGKYAQTIWTRHDRDGSFNACIHCTGENKTIAGLLAELRIKLEREHRATP